MVFAKTRRAARQLARQFERRQVRKLYWACVERVVEPASGTWIDYLHKVYGHPRTTIVEHTHPAAQEAILHYRTLGAHGGGSWLEIELETGRTHQIRCKPRPAATPCWETRTTADAFPFGPQFEDERLRAIALHARNLVFLHPNTRAEIALEAPLPPAWQTLERTQRG